MCACEGNEKERQEKMEKYDRSNKINKGIWVSHADHNIEIDKEDKELKVTKNESDNQREKLMSEDGLSLPREGK